ncbi:FMN-binding protein [Pseudooceanicola sp. LIPI14-2-Ac024]|uniref:FMN-binding protein n=1 Tax=Pseudooceanicola sp. LIPI14-2-Ac024 TaxID=3344875 RepID=UPI0035CF24F7
MADMNPVHLWKRMLAQPNDSRGKTIFVAFATAVICAVFVSAATVILRPIQAANRAAETQLRLETLLGSIPGMTELLSENEEATLSTVVIDLDTGRAAQDVTPETLEAALADSGNWTAIPAGEDIAGLGSRPNYAQIYMLRDGDDVELVILPIAGAGSQGPIEAMIAIDGDMQTIAGLTITSHVETPGLGARIDEPAWQAQFAGVPFRDAQGNVEFSVARGPATNEFQVDGITGATRTGNAMTQIVRFWLGPMGYGPLLDAIARGEF